MSDAPVPILSREDLVNRYAHDGYAFPLTVMSPDEARTYRRDLEAMEARARGSALGNKTQLNYPHVLFRFADRLVRHPAILDMVEALLGPDIIVWGSTFFIKEPHSPGFVSWHQDMRYWGLDDEEGQVSAWLALSPVTRANGCMRFAPGSHRQAMVAHRDTFMEDNFLTRGQQAEVDIDEEAVAHVELEPGQASFHHGRLLHASAPNRSDERRIGLAINYIAPHVRQVVAKQDFGMLVRGEDRYGNFVPVPSPADDFAEEGMAWHSRILAAQNEAMYEGVGNPEAATLTS